MGTTLLSYGDAGYDHEGYAAYVLDDGTLSGTWGPETRPGMTGELVASCDCGWTGTTRYRGAGGDPLDEAAEELALAEWEHDHVRPVLQAAQRGDLDRLQRQLRDLGRAVELSTADRRELAEQLQCVRRRLSSVTELADRLHEQVQQQIAGEHRPPQTPPGRARPEPPPGPAATTATNPSEQE